MARLVVLFALLLIAASPLPPNHVEAHQTKGATEQHHEHPGPVATVHNQGSPKGTPEPVNSYPYNYYYPAIKSESPPVWFQVITALILLAFTFGLWVTSIWQWQAIDKQATIAQCAAKDAREALRLEQRPWLVPTGDAQLSMPNGEIPDDASLLMRFDLKNTGNTPALQVMVRWTYDRRDWFEPMPEDEVSSRHIVHLGAIGPRVAHRIPLTLGPFAEQTRTELFDGTYRLTVRAYIEYRDHLKGPESEPYKTRLCLVWFPLNLTGEGRFVVSGPYNDCT